MAEHKWSLLCYRACIDKHSNMLTILEVTDEITIELIQEPLPENPLLPLSLHLVSMWHRNDPEKPEKFWSSYTISTPGGEVFVAGKSLEGNLETHLRLRLIFGIQGAPFKGAGVYTFNVTVADSPSGPFETVVAQVPLVLKIREDSDASATLPEQPGEPTPAAPRKSSSRRGRGRP